MGYALLGIDLGVMEPNYSVSTACAILQITISILLQITFVEVRLMTAGGTGVAYSQVSRPFSDSPPTHYTLKIESFSLLKKYSVDRFESGEFDAGGYKWKIQLYPKGNCRGKDTHVSLYLTLANPEKLSPASKILAQFTLHILAGGRSFSASIPSWGWPDFITLGNFEQLDKGYLVKDTCLVEAEVTVHGIC
ncbi:ubiquitin carboxyl-terminal hydrolase 12-like [Prunus dulcis]|uniref:ubiquitin carboxyl-terminal hydrolase 12-like n=1 Tax=Prunus dulcis TaxID=3755 RepID=UPI001483CA7F|nr:ubiquitin carboxyl-terminal hydrolase 12-like [Prunus dulcis]